MADYTLYCDDYKNVLSLYKDLVPDGCERQGLSVPCVNNICVLTYNNNTLVGMSFNVPINSPIFESDPLLDLCSDDMTSSGSFVDCSNNQIWYNHDIESIIFDKYLVPNVYLANDNWLTEFGLLIKNKIFDMLETIQILKPESEVLGTPTEIRTEFITGTTDFDRIFMKVSGSKEAVAISGQAIEEIGDSNSPRDVTTGTFIAVNYEGFSGTDICKSIETYDERFHILYPSPPRSFETVVCNQEPGGSYYIFSRDLTGREIWQDLTSKLRFVR